MVFRAVDGHDIGVPALGAEARLEELAEVCLDMRLKQRIRVAARDRVHLVVRCPTSRLQLRTCQRGVPPIIRDESVVPVQHDLDSVHDGEVAERDWAIFQQARQGIPEEFRLNDFTAQRAECACCP